MSLIIANTKLSDYSLLQFNVQYIDWISKCFTQVWEENCRGRGPQREEECPELNMVWLDCNGEDDPDKENIGSISYTPWRGFPAYFFPYWNQVTILRILSYFSLIQNTLQTKLGYLLQQCFQPYFRIRVPNRHIGTLRIRQMLILL